MTNKNRQDQSSKGSDQYENRNDEKCELLAVYEIDKKTVRKECPEDDIIKKEPS